MLPTFVIGLREGLEAALIVGIIAAFLRKQGRRDLLRSVMSGVGIALALCLAAGIALNVYSRNLPTRQQEGLETVIGALAVVMVTYMVVWMRRNSRNLKGQLEGLAADALAGTSGAARAMVLMAFLAVIREGVETVVFLLAAFNEASNPRLAGLGVVLGIAVAVALGYGIYRGGVRLNLSKFFRATGLVLVLVAAGIVVNALHTAHEAGWLDAGQGRTVDLGWLVRPGTVQASLLTGMLGIQSHPVTVEVLGWLAYLIPVGLYVAWPPGRPAPARLAARIGLGVGVVAVLGAIVLTVLRPSLASAHPSTSGGTISAAVVSRDGQGVVLRTQRIDPTGGASTGTSGPTARIRLASVGLGRHDGVTAERFRASVPAAASRPASSVPLARVLALNDGRLPLSTVRSADGRVPTSYRTTTELTAWVDVRTDRVLDLVWTGQTVALVRTSGALEQLARPVASGRVNLPAAAAAAAVSAARTDHTRLDRRHVIGTFVGWSIAVAVVSLLTALGFALAARRTVRSITAAPTPSPVLLRS